MSLRLELLGPTRVHNDADVSLDRPSHRRLLAILALDAGHPTTTDLLIERFWAGEPPATAKAALHTHVSAVRKTLGDEAIITESDGYRLNVAATSLDTSDFTELAEDAKQAAAGRDWGAALSAAEAAAALWRGRPFAELIDDDFARPTTAKLDELRLELLELRASALLGLNRPADALPELEGLVLEHPLRERLWEHLMTARYRLGRHTEALRAYREVAGHLAEIGVEPGERLRRLEDRILLHDKTLIPTPNNLPVELSAFLGREGEMNQTTKLLADNRMVTLVGAGGSGKTRVAVHVARRLLSWFRDGVWLVELAGIQDPKLVPTAIARSIGIRPRGDDVLEVIVNAIAGEKVLIILDNCEHLLEGASAIAERLLQSSTELRILATSRQRLRLPGESTFELPGMTLPDPPVSSAKGALDFEAIQLFDQRSRQVNPSFRLDDSNVEAVINICRRLDGMPLSIELAAARTSSMSASDIANRLEDHAHLLTGGSSTAPPRQRTMHATIEWSYRLLDENERAVLGRLSVFRGGFPLSAAEQVVAGAGMDVALIAPHISNLVDKTLVTMYDAPGGRRYRLLETVRQYAKEQLEAQGDESAPHSSHLQWCLGLVDDLWERAVGGGQAELAATLEAEGDNLQAALEQARTTDDRLAVTTLSQALAWRWYLAGLLGNCNSILRASLSQSGSDQDTALMRALLARSLAYSEDIAGAVAEARLARDLLGRVTNPLAKTWIISTVQLGYFMSVDSDPRQMLVLAEEARSIAAEGRDRYAEIIARQTTADALSWNGRTADGLEQQRMAIELAEASGDPVTINRIYGMSIYNFMLDPVARRTEPMRVVADWMSRIDLDADTWVTTATDWLPWVHMQAGDLDSAGEAVDWIGGRVQEGYNRTIFLLVRASVAWMRGDLPSARGDIDELANRGVSDRWAHTYYPLAADVCADQGLLEDLRSVVETYQAMEVHPTREATKLGVLNPLVRAEVDAAIDTGSADHANRAGQAMDEMHRILAECPPLVGSWTSIMTHPQNLAFAQAELTRILEPRPDLWIAARAKADYAYYQQYAAWRRAEALLETGQGVPADLKTVYGSVVRLGAGLLRTRVRTTASKFGISLTEANTR